MAETVPQKIVIEAESIPLLVELVTRSVIKILDERSPTLTMPEWQSSAATAAALGISRNTLNESRDRLRPKVDYRIVPGDRLRFQYHVENCRQRLGRN